MSFIQRSSGGLSDVFANLCIIVCFSFLLVFSCLVLSVFSTIPEHHKFANQGLFILVRPPPPHTLDGLLSIRACSFLSRLLQCVHICLLMCWFVCRRRERQPCKQVGGFRCCWLRSKSDTQCNNRNCDIIPPSPSSFALLLLQWKVMDTRFLLLNPLRPPSLPSSHLAHLYVLFNGRTLDFHIPSVHSFDQSPGH